MENFFFGALAVGIIWFSRGVYLAIKSPAEYWQTFTKSIKVPGTWHDPYLMDTANGVAHFKLGEGACGLTVTELHGSWSYPNKENFTVKQYCSDGSSKLFHYRREDITGRIEETFEKKLVK